MAQFGNLTQQAGLRLIPLNVPPAERPEDAYTLMFYVEGPQGYKAEWHATPKGWKKA